MLARLRKKTEDNEGGFTLIELLVVIIIIGILAAIAIPVFLNQRKKGVDASIKSDLRQAANEMESYFTDGQAYSVSLVTPIRRSSGNIIYVKLNAATPAAADGYCLQASNPKASANGGTGTSAKHYYYDSKAGGLNGTAGVLPTTGACASVEAFTLFPVVA